MFKLLNACIFFIVTFGTQTAYAQVPNAPPPSSGSVTPAASDVVYRCVKGENPPNYTNQNEGSHCTRLSGIAVTTIPAYKPTKPSASVPRPNQEPADFPKVSADAQRDRDAVGRKPLLEKEVKERNAQCDAQRKTFNNGSPTRLPSESANTYFDRIVVMKAEMDRCDADVAALKRELAAVGGR